MLKIFVGFDAAIEPIAYHTFCQSVIEKASIPVSFTPLALNTLNGYKETHGDGSNAFIYSRFLVPYLCDYKGYAIFVDGDMLCRTDIKELMDIVDPLAAVSVVKHDYKTKYPTKYLGFKNEDYPRKNWSSVMVWNCDQFKNKQLTPEYIMKASGKELHRFEWLDNQFINLVGEIPKEWNWLVSEYGYNPDAKLVHFTLGTPCFTGYKNCDYANEWWETYHSMIYPLVGNNKETQL
jgi:lipopolysaccharide biosynthesis glycosyltransferase